MLKFALLALALVSTSASAATIKGLNCQGATNRAQTVTYSRQSNELMVQIAGQNLYYTVSNVTKDTANNYTVYAESNAGKLEVRVASTIQGSSWVNASGNSFTAHCAFAL